MLTENNLPSKLINESDSNKTHIANDYGSLYDLVISSLLQLNQKPIRALEIGFVHYGRASGHVFSEAPYIEKFVGVDVKRPMIPLPDKGVFIQSDAYAESTLELVKPHAPFHLIIDDGTHNIEHQQFFFKHYLQYLDTPGVFWCEDIKDSQVEECLEIFNNPRIHAIKVPSIKSHEDRHRNAFLILNLSSQINSKLKYEAFYSALELERRYLSRLSELDSLESELLKSMQNWHQADGIVLDWYNTIRNECQNLRNDSEPEERQSMEYYHFKRVSTGVSDESASKFVRDWWKSQKVDNDE